MISHRTSGFFIQHNRTQGASTSRFPPLVASPGFLRSIVPNNAGFSLIELMIVVAILGVLTCIIIPMFTYSESNAQKDAVSAEMAAIQSAWTDFYNDCFPDEGELEELSHYGLYALFSTNKPDGYSGNWDNAIRGNYDPYNKLGWKGPYLISEGTVKIDPDSALQPYKNNGFPIPVVFTPYDNNAREGDSDYGPAYYRVRYDSEKLTLLCPNDGTEFPLAPF